MPTPEQLAEMNRRQRNEGCGPFEMRHPLTCGNPDRHRDGKHTDGEGVLVATPDGWACPFCDYRQPFGGPSGDAGLA